MKEISDAAFRTLLRHLPNVLDAVRPEGGDTRLRESVRQLRRTIAGLKKSQPNGTNRQQTAKEHQSLLA